MFPFLVRLPTLPPVTLEFSIILPCLSCSFFKGGEGSLTLVCLVERKENNDRDIFVCLITAKMKGEE